MTNKKNKRASTAETTSAPKKKKVAETPTKKQPEKPKFVYVDSDDSEDPNEVQDKNNDLNLDLVENGTKTSEAEDNKEIPPFTMENLNKLLDNVKKAIPENDTLKFNTRLEKFDWDKVKFDKFSAEDCKKLFFHSISFIRKYKTLNEVVNETQQAASKSSSKIYKVNCASKPRHPSSSYMIFANEIRDKLRKQNPNLTIIEIGKLIGEKWRQMPASKKEKYVKKFEENKKVYQEEITKYNSEHNQPEKKKKDFDRPKTPLMIYLSEKIDKENPDLEGKSIKEKQSYYKTKYNQLSDKKKFKYIQKCIEAEEKFVEKLKDKLKTSNVDYKSVLNKQERDIVEKMNGKPTNPPANGYSLFVKENIIKPEVASAEPKLKNSILANKWKALDKTAKDQYNSRAKLAQEQFITDMGNYVRNLSEKEAVELFMSSTGIAKDIIARRIETLARD